MTENEIRIRCLDVVGELIRTQLKVPNDEAARAAAPIVDALLLKLAAAGIWRPTSRS